MSDSHWLRMGKTIAWRLARGVEKLGGWNPYFHGAHKHQKQWLMSDPNYSFIEENLRRPGRLFAEFFHSDVIAANVHSLLETNWSVTSRS
jgi:hypothetical protein